MRLSSPKSEVRFLKSEVRLLKNELMLSLTKNIVINPQNIPSVTKTALMLSSHQQNTAKNINYFSFSDEKFFFLSSKCVNKIFSIFNFSLHIVSLVARVLKKSDPLPNSS
ncbi:hypothetical protein ACKWTF_014884 [Chironomus riparius]